MESIAITLGREETLTEGALFWNKRKTDSLARMLRTWYDKVNRILFEFISIILPTHVVRTFNVIPV